MILDLLRNSMYYIPNNNRRAQAEQKEFNMTNDKNFNEIKEMINQAESTDIMITVYFYPALWEENEEIRIGGQLIAKREKYDSYPTLYANSEIVTGTDFSSTGGCKSCPSVEPELDTVMRAELPLRLYINLSEREQKGLVVGKPDTNFDNLGDPETRRILKRLLYIQYLSHWLVDWED